MTLYSRRHFLHGSLALAGLGLLAGCALLPSGAPQPTKIRRVGALSFGAGPSPQAEAFRQGLRDLGYVEGRDVEIEWRFGEKRDDLVGRATELVGSGVDVILAAGAGTAYAARNATREVPIVFTEEQDPVGSPSFPQQRLVESLARPGGNVTGLATLAAGLSGKRLELLKDVVPGLVRVALLVSSAEVSLRNQAVSELSIAAPRLGLVAQALVAREPQELGPAFEQAVRGGVSGLVVVGDPLLRAQAGQVADLAVRHRLPAMYDAREFAEAAGLMAYGPNLVDVYRRAAGYVDKILKGARPADLPVEQPTRFDFVINFKTARDIGLTIPQSVLIQATEVIQ